MSKSAVTTAPIHSLLANRWSTRAFDANAEISTVELTSLLEAARWAPSSNNGQPWRFAVAKRSDALFAKITEALAGFNKEWAPTAAAYVVAITETEDSAGSPRKSAEFDLGLAVSALTTQATADGWSTHQMGGFSASAIRELLKLEPKLKPVVVIAVGKHSDTIEISEALQARETAPRTRLELSEIVLNPEALA
jgi:nitroreductase